VRWDQDSIPRYYIHLHRGRDIPSLLASGLNWCRSVWLGSERVGWAVVHFEQFWREAKAGQGGRQGGSGMSAASLMLQIIQ
jgi:hypothetical protein